MRELTCGRMGYGKNRKTLNYNIYKASRCPSRSESVIMIRKRKSCESKSIIEVDTGSFESIIILAQQAPVLEIDTESFLNEKTDSHTIR